MTPTLDTDNAPKSFNNRELFKSLEDMRAHLASIDSKVDSLIAAVREARQIFDLYSNGNKIGAWRASRRNDAT